MSNMERDSVDGRGQPTSLPRLRSSVPRADVLQQAVDDERDDCRGGHAQADDPEHASDTCERRRSARRGRATPRAPRAPREHERDEAEHGCERDRETRVQEVVVAR